MWLVDPLAGVVRFTFRLIGALSRVGLTPPARADRSSAALGRAAYAGASDLFFVVFGCVPALLIGLLLWLAR